MCCYNSAVNALELCALGDLRVDKSPVFRPCPCDEGVTASDTANTTVFVCTCVNSEKWTLHRTYPLQRCWTQDTPDMLTFPCIQLWIVSPYTIGIIDHS